VSDERVVKAMAELKAALEERAVEVGLPPGVFGPVFAALERMVPTTVMAEPVDVDNTGVPLE
jgi:hypothetical protein